MNWTIDLHKTIASEQMRRAEEQRLLKAENDTRRGKRARKNR